MEAGVRRWVVDISQWDPPPRDFSSALSLLPSHDHSSITRYWSLKEAYVKAIGSGLTAELNKVEFYHTSWTNISARVDGKALTEWRFWLFEFGKRHCVSIARGHPRSAAGSYKTTLKKVEFNEEEYQLGLHLPSADFVTLSVEQLISVLQRAVNCMHRN